MNQTRLTETGETGIPWVFSWVRYGVLCALATVVFLYSGYSVNRFSQHAEFEEDARRATSQLSSQIDEMRSLMTSLFGIHYLSMAFAQESLIVVSEQFRGQAPFVSALARVEMVSSEELLNFENDQSERGLYNFQVNEIDSEGRLQTRASQEQYFPVSMLEPMAPSNLSLIGADLGSLPGMQERMLASIRGNEPMLATLPKSWPLGGQLLYFRPAYHGQNIPETPDQRLLHFDVGYVIVADLATIVEGVDEDLSRFALSLGISDSIGRSILFERLESPVDPILFGSLYPKESMDWQQSIGSSRFTVGIQSRIGFAPTVVLGGVVVYLLGLIMSILLLVMARHRQRSAAERAEANRVLFNERENASMTLNSISDSVITLDTNFCILHLNNSAMELLGGVSTAAVGSVLSNVLPLKPLDDSFEIFNSAEAMHNLQGADQAEFDLKAGCARFDNSIFRVMFSRTSGERRQSDAYIVVLRDISSEAKFTRELEHQANHDSLTGCTNRNYFERRLAELIDDAPLSGREHALCYMDLDQFKIVNDTCGHQAGDLLLCEITESLQGLIRRGDVLSRLGGDEFGLIILDADPDAAHRIANKMLSFFQSFVFRHDQKAFAVRASIGLVLLDQNSGSISDALAAADIACYSAKDSGRNTLSVYSPDDKAMTERSTELNWLPRLQEALSNDQFRLHAQPVVAIGPKNPGRLLTHFELLLRLDDGAGRLLTPWQFIKAAERYDLMREIDRWVIENAMREVSKLRHGPAAHCTWSINLSGQSAADPTLFDFIFEQFTRFGVDPRNFWFELTETAAIAQFSTAVDLIEKIRCTGAKVALDDFGSGLSSFGYLKNLPVDVIKIDGQFVRDLATNPVDQEMIRAIHQVGKAMGIQTVAEFVEDELSLLELERIGVDFAQGYHLGKPQPMYEAVALLSMQRAA